MDLIGTVGGYEKQPIRVHEFVVSGLVLLFILTVGAFLHLIGWLGMVIVLGLGALIFFMCTIVVWLFLFDRP
jgi:hypothetical protein